MTAYVVCTVVLVAVSFELSRWLSGVLRPRDDGAERLRSAGIYAVIAAGGLTALLAFPYSPLLAFGAATIGQVATAAGLGRRKMSAADRPALAS